jgi:hypothetical protein
VVKRVRKHFKQKNDWSKCSMCRLLHFEPLLKMIWTRSHTKNKKFTAWPKLSKLQRSKNADNSLLGTLLMTYFLTRNCFCCKRPTINITTGYNLFLWELSVRSQVYIILFFSKTLRFKMASKKNMYGTVNILSSNLNNYCS